MSAGYWIAIIIAILALVVIAIVGAVAFKKVQPTLNNLQDMQKNINNKMEHFNHEAEVIQGKVDHLTKRVEKVQSEANVDMEVFDELNVRANELQNSLNMLKETGSENADTIAKDTYEELKEEGPILAETFKRAFKGTYQKQRNRYN